MKPEYIEFNGKHPMAAKENRHYYDEPQKSWISYGASYSADFLKIDIDDYTHGTGELEEPVCGKPRSDAIIAILESLHIKYNAIKTEHGRHLFFRTPACLERKNKMNWYSPLGIKAEWKFPSSDDHIPLVINGIERRFFKGSITNEDVDELPPFLYPLQKSKTRPFDMNFVKGDRTQNLWNYLFNLVRKKYTAEQAFQIVRLMNEYIFESPIPERTLEAEILNNSTLEKLQKEEASTPKKEISPDSFRGLISEKGMFIRYNELLNIVEFDNLPDEPEFQDINDLQNQMPTALQYAFRKYTGLKNIGKQQTIDLISLEADRNSYNPVKDYLQGTIWDGSDRFPELFRALNVQNSFEQCLIRKWFYQSAALPFNTLSNPIQPEGVLILQGDEGIGKTQFFRRMTANPIWFKSLDKPMSTKNKDTLIETLSAWITEIGEIDRTFTERRSDLKSFMTSEKDTIRKPYAREPITRARTTSICGTTNKAEFLNDETGSRRWWVVHILGKIDLGKFTRQDNLSQFWAQCYLMTIQDSKCFRLTDDEKKQLEERNQSVMELLPAEDELRLRFDFNAPESEWNWIQPAALKNIPEYDVTQYSAIVIGKALTKISEDFPMIRREKHNGLYKWFIPPTNIYSDRFRNTG